MRILEVLQSIYKFFSPTKYRSDKKHKIGYQKGLKLSSHN